MGALSASRFYGEQSVNLGGTEFEQAVTLQYAKIDGNLDMDYAILDRDLVARSEPACS